MCESPRAGAVGRWNGFRSWQLAHLDCRGSNPHPESPGSPDVSLSIFPHDRLRRWCWLGCFRRDHKGQPCRPPLWPVLDLEILVSLEVQIALIVADRKQEADLRTDADRHSAEAAELRAGTGVVREL